MSHSILPNSYLNFESVSFFIIIKFDNAKIFMYRSYNLVINGTTKFGYNASKTDYRSI